MGTVRHLSEELFTDKCLIKESLHGKQRERDKKLITA